MAQTWNALQQAQILSNQSPENSIGTMDCNGMPVEPDESFDHEIEEFIEKENFPSMMDLEDIAESDIKDLESGSLQHTCYESSWQDGMCSDEVEQDKPVDKGENDGNLIPYPLPDSVEVESILEAHSDKVVLEPAFEDASLVEYSDISSCSDTEGNFDCNLSSSIDVNMGGKQAGQPSKDVNMDGNQAGQPSEEGNLNSSMHLSSTEVCHSIVEVGMSEINDQQDTGPPVSTGESSDSVNHTSSDCSEGSLLPNAEVSSTELQGLNNVNGGVLLSKDREVEEREMTYDLESLLDHCKELSNSQDGSNCASNQANIDTLTFNGDENVCPTIDSISVCQLERTTPDIENPSQPTLEKTFVISGEGKGPLGDCQLDKLNPNPENASSKSNFQEIIKRYDCEKDSLDGCLLESNQLDPKSPSSKSDVQNTIGISGHKEKSLDGCQVESSESNLKTTSSKPVHENSSQLEGQKCFTSDEQVERSSFGFLESCFGFSTVQSTKELKHPEPAHANKVNECSLFNHTDLESKNKMDEGTAVPNDPPVLCTDQMSKVFLDPGQQKCLPSDGTISSKESSSNLKTLKRKLQPVVLLKTTEKSTCDGKKYICFECQESTQSVDELIEHYHCMHSLHKSQYCLSCEIYCTGGTMAGNHVCGKVKLNDKKKSSPLYTKVTQKEAKFICRYCKKAFVRQPYHLEHELRHRVVTQHRCDCCGLYFPNAQKRQSHKRKIACPPLILDPFLETAEHPELIHEKNDIPDVAETVGSSVELRNCFVKLMDVCKTSQSPERIYCRVCGKTFRLRAQLNAHLRSHSDEKPFKCDNCEKAFKYTWNLNKHKREQCYEKIVPHEKSSLPDSNFRPKFKCPICFRIFKYSYNRTRHLRHQCLKEYMKTGKGKIGEKYWCPLCKDMFTMATNRNRHIKQTCVKLKLYRAKGKVKNKKELEECNWTKKEDKKSPLTTSIQKASRYKCKFCPSEYSSKSGYYNHLAKHKLLNKKAVKQKHANATDLKNSGSAVERPTNQESADLNSRIPYSCRFCGRAFASPDSLKKHLTLHKGNKPFRCLDCGKNFARHGHLMSHKNVHKRNVQCSVCWEVLPSIGDLLKHRLSHPKKGMLKCPDCPLQFKFPVFLLRHVAVHERRRKLMELLPPKEQAAPQKVQEMYKEEFKCALCQEAFIDSKALSEHCLTHMPGPTASKCQFCKRHFSSRAGLIRHIRLHTGEKPFPCTTCGRHFHRKEVLKMHLEKCLVKQVRPLQKNTKQMQAGHSVDTASKKTGKAYNCSYCPHSFRFPNNLKLHEKAHLAKTVFPCSKCGKFYRKRKFKQHVELCNGDKMKPACRKCGKVFTRKNYLNGHENQCKGMQNKAVTETVKGINEKGKYKHQCPQCFKSFRSSIFLHRHMALHSKETPYSCMHCGQKFDSEERYLQHEAFCDGLSKERRLESLRGSEKIKSMFEEVENQKDVTVVPGENGELFKCKFCTKSFLRARYLRRHILTHTEVKPYRCKTCESCFSRYDHLKLHQARCRGKRQLEVRAEKVSLNSSSTSFQSQTQEDGDSLQCKICSKQLSTSSDLKRHMAMVHITDKPFPCKRCGKTYSSVKSLRRHNETIRCKKISKESVSTAKNDVQSQPCRETSKLLQRIQVHYMNKFKYQCEYCPRRFKLSGQLKVHVRLHTGEKPYGCANCGEHFIRTDYLKRHFAKCNGKGENQEKILCDKCGDLFTQDTLPVHQKTCVISSKSSGSSQQVNNKSKSPTKIKGFSCANCSDRFLLFSQLQQHFLAKHRSDQPQNNSNQQQLVLSHVQVIKQEQVDQGYGQNQESSSEINARERPACLNTNIIKPLKCPQCNMRFSRSTGLGMHMRIHKGVYPLSCTKCHVGFWTRKTMEKHRRKCTGHTLISNNGSAVDGAGDETVLVFNKGSNTTGTGVLQTKFSCKDQDQENEAEKDVSVNKYQCSECDQSFTDGLRLISHLEEHGREDQERRSDIHRCHVCNKVFAQAGILHRHMKMQHNEKMNYTCDICFKSFRFPSDLDIHKTSHDPSRPFPCSSCKMRFLTAKALTVHHRMAHLHAPPTNSKESSVKARMEQPKVYRCEPCDKTYTIKRSYTKHLQVKHRDDVIKPLADNELKTSSASASQESDEEDQNFDDENDSDNDSDSAPYFPCHVCGKTFLTSESLEDHQRCHLGEKPFECEECGKCFFQLVNLQQHQRCHKSEFQCQMCGKGFVSLFSLRKHKQTHIKKSPHRCTKCHLSFTRSTELAEHMVTHRDENFPCDLCDKTFSCKTSRAEHRKMHTEQDEDLPPLIPPKPPQTMQVSPAITSNVDQYKYRCGICQVRFPDPEQLSEHGCNPAKERPYSCPECNKHFLHGSHLKKHQLSHQLTGPRSYQCNHCSMSFTHHHLFLTHLRSHSNEKTSKDTSFPTSEKMIRVEPVKRDKIYQCPICPESFYQALDLANHLSVHSHMCSVCNMTFPTKKDLDEHEQCHLTAATQYECTECGDSFLGSDAFRKHHCSNRNMTFSEKHRSEPSVSSSKKQSSQTRFQVGDEEEEDVDVGEDFIICPICKRRFSSNSSLMEHHIKHHEDPRPFKCLVCKKGFTKKRYLTQHQQIHSERPYKCEVCSESFKSDTTLVTHRKLHDAKRQYQCPMCSRTYLTANDLAKHKRKHAERLSLSEDNQEYRCDMCYKSFTMFAHLQKHQESHVGQVVYECTECDKAFAFLNLLEEHQRTHGAASTESLQSQSPTQFSYQSSVNE